MNEWNIQSRAHGCQACHKPFADQAVYHTLLIDAKQHYQRLDVCDGCWKSQYGEGSNERKGFISYWQGIYEVPPAAPPDAIQKENAESLLRKLVETGDPAHTASVYILAVMLERKRVLKVKEQLIRDGRRSFLYEHPKTGDLLTVLDPNLQLNQLEGVQRDIAQLLEHGLNPPPDSGAASETVGPPAEESSAPNVPSSELMVSEGNRNEAAMP